MWQQFVAVQLATCALAAVPLAAQAGPHGSHGAKTIDNETAMHLFFLLVRDAPPPAWSLETRINHLRTYGFERAEAIKIVSAANDYFDRTALIDWRIKRVNSRELSRGNASEVIAATGPLRGEKRAILRDVVARLGSGLGTGGENRLWKHMEHVKKNSR